jgi:hypothetical protein
VNSRKCPNCRAGSADGRIQQAYQEPLAENIIPTHPDLINAQKPPLAIPDAHAVRRIRTLLTISLDRPFDRLSGRHNVFGVSTNPPASSQPESPPLSENTFWYPIFWRLSAASAPRFPPALEQASKAENL